MNQETTGQSPFQEPEAVLFVFLQNDPDKEYNWPKAGTVNVLTRNVGVTHSASTAQIVLNPKFVKFLLAGLFFCT